MTSLEKIRRASQRRLLLLVWAHVPALGAIAWVMGASVLLAFVGGLGLALLATLAAWSSTVGDAPTSTASRGLIAAAATGQVAVFVSELAGHPWQVDAHMYFFAVMGMLLALVDWRALIAGAAVVAVHHLSLNFIAAELIYPGGSDFGRTLFHAVVLILMTGALIAIALFVSAVLTASDLQAAAIEERSAEAEAARAAADETRAAADAERERTAGRLRDGIGSVVAAAEAGDFSQRVDVDLPDPAMAELAVRVNGLISAVDAGVEETTGTMRRIAQGDLAARMPEHLKGGFGALAQDVNATAAVLQELVARTANASAALESKAQSIRSGSEKLAGEAEGSATSLEQTAATMEEMSATIGSNAESASRASDLSAEAKTRADRGQEIVRDAVAAMDGIEGSATKIGDITSVIDAIAFQTNLLALNAAVEAARAGDTGKGFAVVASEVRTLSQRSADAARDIKSLIQESRDNVDDGARLVKAAGEALTGITESVAAVSNTIDEISLASREQASGVAEITAAISAMDHATQQNAAVAEESAATARQLTDEAGALRAIIGQFGGDQGAAPAIPAPTPTPEPAREDAHDADWTTVAAEAKAGLPVGAAANGDDGDWTHF